jgi:TatA/E family protein of Tat protein translocase
MNSPAILAVMGLGTTEILVILFIILLLFGAKKLPELAKGLGKSMNEFKKASAEAEKEFNEGAKENDGEPTPKKPTASSTPRHGDN